MARSLTPLALAVLHLLDEQPMHPYEMQQVIKVRYIDHVVKVAHGSLYHTVERLAVSGLIEPVETSRSGRRPERTVYAITDEGRDQAADRLCELIARPAREFPGFKAALAFATTLSPRKMSELLARRCVALEVHLATHTTLIDTLTKQGLPRINLIEVEHVVSQCRAELDYVRALQEDIDGGRLTWTPGVAKRIITAPLTEEQP
ncbi:PadR family transcriptional regulator [Actinomadura scrupuli]|uniref:PadR family transcriptional regulator n=1 Tax=Actinomadura scrupuli TaxID=559629 RepID=UPI003D95F529